MSSKNSANNHLARVNSDITRVLTVAIQQKMKDDSLVDVVVTRVETTADMSQTTIYVNGHLNALERASGTLRNEIAQNVKMKQTPRLKFVLDKGIENAARVDELLAQINRPRRVDGATPL